MSCTYIVEELKVSVWSCSVYHAPTVTCHNSVY